MFSDILCYFPYSSLDVIDIYFIPNFFKFLFLNLYLGAIFYKK